MTRRAYILDKLSYIDARIIFGHALMKRLTRIYPLTEKELS